MNDHFNLPNELRYWLDTRILDCLRVVDSPSAFKNLLRALYELRYVVLGLIAKPDPLIADYVDPVKGKRFSVERLRHAFFKRSGAAKPGTPKEVLDAKTAMEKYHAFSHTDYEAITHFDLTMVMFRKSSLRAFQNVLHIEINRLEETIGRLSR